MSAIEIAKTPTAPTLESIGDVIVVDDLFDGHIGFVEGVSDFVDPSLSFDVLSGFVSRSNDVHDSSSMDLSTFEYICLSLVICFICTIFTHITDI